MSLHTVRSDARDKTNRAELRTCIPTKFRVRRLEENLDPVKWCDNRLGLQSISYQHPLRNAERKHVRRSRQFLLRNPSAGCSVDSACHTWTTHWNSSNGTRLEAQVMYEMQEDKPCGVVDADEGRGGLQRKRPSDLGTRTLCHPQAGVRGPAFPANPLGFRTCLRPPRPIPAHPFATPAFAHAPRALVTPPPAREACLQNRRRMRRFRS